MKKFFDKIRWWWRDQWIFDEDNLPIASLVLGLIISNWGKLLVLVILAVVIIWYLA